ncbi:MAG: protein kinase [Phycisphaerales bacterium]
MTDARLDDDSWFAQVRDAVTPVAGGRLADMEIIEEIGAGGQGRVYKARQRGTGRLVALKRLRAGARADAEERARFRREVELSASLRHPGIVTVLALDESESSPTLIMEWVDGEPIDRWADDARARPGGVRRVVETVRLACEAVAAAHGRTVLHRDLKPSNILVDRTGHPRVLDFGLARRLNDDPTPTLTHAGGFVGTPSYASPEQIEGGPAALDVRTDVYALGAVLYRAVTGRPAIDPGTGLAQQVESIRGGRHARPSRVNPAVDAELECIIALAMAPERDARYATAAALADDLGRWLDGRAVVAHAPGAMYLTRKFVARHRRAVSLALVALVLIVAGGVTAGVLALRLSHKETELEGALDELRGALERERGATAEATASRDRAKREVLKQRAALTIMFHALSAMRQSAAGSNPLTIDQAIDARIASLDDGRGRMPADVESAVRIALGVLCLQLERFDTAERQFEKVVSLLESSPEATFDLSEAHGQLGTLALRASDHERALRHLTLAVDLTRADPEQAADIGPRQLRLARALLGAGRIDDAERTAREATSVGGFFARERDRVLEEIRERRERQAETP